MRTKTQPPRHRTRIVRNKSSRNGARIVGIAVHSTESRDIPHSWDDLTGIGNWFDNPAAQASSTIGVDGDGNSVRWVPDDMKPWTILDWNSVTLNIEFVGRAAQPASEWEDAQLRTAAKWAAYWCHKYGIKPRRGRGLKVAGRPVIVRSGIVRHSDLTALGFGSHSDPGKNFPMRRFLQLVKWYFNNGWVI